MRIRMVGNYSIYGLMDALDCVVQTLKCNGVDEVRSISIYLNLYRDKCLLDFKDSDTGAPFEILEYNGRKSRPYRTVSPRVTPVFNASGEGDRHLTVADIIGQPSHRSDRSKRK